MPHKIAKNINLATPIFGSNNWGVSSYHQMNIIYFLYLYLLLGCIYSFYFVFFRLQKIDSSAKHTSLFFKSIIFGGCILLWPVLIFKKNISHQ